MFFEIANHYSTILVLSGDNEKPLENVLIVIKNWPEIRKI